MQNKTNSPKSSTVQASFCLDAPRFEKERNHKLNLENKLLESAIELALRRARQITNDLSGDVYELRDSASIEAWYTMYSKFIKIEFLSVFQHNKANTLIDYVSDVQTLTVA